MKLSVRVMVVMIVLAVLAAVVGTAEASGKPKSAKAPPSSGWSTVTLGDAAWD